MLNSRGSTLIESLFAFEIFISVLVLLLISLSTIYSHEIRLRDHYDTILKKEESLLESEDFTNLIEMVLH